MAKAREMQPDWTTFNGYANQYVTHPLTADPGDTVRFYVVAAGPTLDTNFHVVGTILDRAWVNGDMTQFQRGVQTVGVPAGGGAVFDVKIDEEGHVPLRQPRVRARRPRPGRSPQDRQPADHDEPLSRLQSPEPARAGGRSSTRGLRASRRCPASSEANDVGELLDALALERVRDVVVVDAGVGEALGAARAASSTPSVIVSRTSPWSWNASIVSNGIVLTVSGPISSST